MTTDTKTLRALIRLSASMQHHTGDVQGLWQEVEGELTQVFGQRLFTALMFDQPTRRLVRVYSNRLDINPVGGCKSVTDSPWVSQVLLRGEVFVGSTREDIQRVFSEYQTLWGIGCESVLNIPVRHRGVTCGSLNLLDGAGQYDEVDPRVAALFGQLLVPLLQEALGGMPSVGQTQGHMEQV